MQPNPVFEVKRLLQTILVGGEADPPSDEALAILEQLFRESEDWLRELILHALCDLGPDARKVTSVLVLSLQDRNELVARRAARALGDVGPAAALAVPDLIAALRARPDAVGREVVAALGAIGPPAAEAVPELLPFLGNPELRYRAIATAAVRNIGENAVPLLVEHLADPKTDINGRLRAATLLGRLGDADDSVLTVLRAAAADPNLDVAETAKQALAALDAGGGASVL
jgi:hypothetical protein